MSATRTYMPWWPYDHFEFEREPPLKVCPSDACRRSKTCCSAYRDTYCLRLFMTKDDYYDALADKLERLEREFAANPSPIRSDPVTGLRDFKKALEQHLADYESDMFRKWQSGELDHVYGKYDSKRKRHPPPKREYVDLRAQDK